MNTRTASVPNADVRVNVIGPGPIETPGFSVVVGTPEQVAKLKEQLVRVVPLGQVRQADEIAKAVLLLASDESSFITGAKRFADGGLAQV